MNRQQLGTLAAGAAVLLFSRGLALADEGDAVDPHAAHRAMMQAAPANAAADPHAAHGQVMQMAEDIAVPDVAPETTSISIPDAVLTNQHGQPLNLLHDVVGDRIVVMDFVYTNCTTVCPVLSAVLMQVQSEVEDALGSEVVLASLTVDAARDTPRQLNEYSQKFGASENWHWLTSDKATMDAVLQELGAYTANFEDHPSMIIVGDAKTGTWSRFAGFPTPRLIAEKVAQLRAARGMAAHQHH